MTQQKTLHFCTFIALQKQVRNLFEHVDPECGGTPCGYPINEPD